MSEHTLVAFNDEQWKIIQSYREAERKLTAERDQLRARCNELLEQCNSNYEPLRKQLERQDLERAGYWYATQIVIDQLRAELEQAREAIKGIFANPQGCPMCDAGVLRNPKKSHWDDCPYEIAKNLLGEDGQP